MLEVKKYDFSLEGFGFESDICEQMVNDYNQGYLCDIQHEVADNNVNIHDNDLWENASKYKEYTEEYIKEVGVDFYAEDFNLTNIFKLGEYYYNEKVLYNNMEFIIFNIAVNYINEKIIDVKNDVFSSYKTTLESICNERIENCIEENSLTVSEKYEDIYKAIDNLINEVLKNDITELEHDLKVVDDMLKADKEEKENSCNWTEEQELNYLQAVSQYAQLKTIKDHLKSCIS